MAIATCTFDAAAGDYAQQLQQGIGLSGESAAYFVEGRVAFLQQFLDNRMPLHGLNVLDFGCGVGNACGVLRERLNARQIVGLDPSAESLTIAESRYPSTGYKWTHEGNDIEPGSLDVVYTSGVFHHIEPAHRAAEIAKIFTWLKPGGYFALFENNPWNPGTKWVMSRIPFDRDARCLSICESRGRLKQAGFQLETTRSLFYFPRLLSWLRPLENGPLAVLPLGAQYVVLAKRPH